MEEQEVIERLFEMERRGDAAEHAFIPLRDGEILAQGAEIQQRDTHSGQTEMIGGADHEGGFAHLARGEDIAELALPQRGAKRLIGLAGHIGDGHPREGATGDIKRCSLLRSHPAPFFSLSMDWAMSIMQAGFRDRNDKAGSETRLCDLFHVSRHQRYGDDRNYPAPTPSCR